PKDLPTPLLEALGNPDLAAQLTEGAIDALCKDPQTLDNLFHDPTGSRAWICFAVTHQALPDALAAKLAIHDGAHTLEQRIDSWVIQAALKDFDSDKATDDSAFRLLAEIAFDIRCPSLGAQGHPSTSSAPASARDAWPCKGARLGPGATITVSWLG